MNDWISLALGSLLAIFFIAGFLCGMGVQRYRDRNLRARLKVAEVTLIQQQGRVNQLQTYKDDLMKEFAEGKWEAV